MQKNSLLNFEQNDQGGGKSASPHYAGRSEMNRIAARAQKECSFRWVSGWKALVRHTDAVEVCGIRTRSKLTSKWGPPSGAEKSQLYEGHTNKQMKKNDRCKTLVFEGN